MGHDIDQSGTDEARIDICVCTFRRAHIAETLRSLARLPLRPNGSFHVIVADNDETPSAWPLVKTVAQDTGLPVTYLHAPARNISIARNACLDAAKAPLVAFIDDDEIATSGWLAALTDALDSSGADAVLGPVQAVYGPECPGWMREGDFHSTRPVWVEDEITTGYSCNVLFRREAAPLQGRRFREDLGRSGGEDTVFFAETHQAGGRIAYAPDAVVTEAVTPDRAQLSWLLRRRFRSGQTHGLMLAEKGGGMPLRAKNILIATAKAVFCLMDGLFHIRRSVRMRAALLRGALHAGVVSRLLGKRELEHYG